MQLVTIAKGEEHYGPIVPLAVRHLADAMCGPVQYINGLGCTQYSSLQLRDPRTMCWSTHSPHGRQSRPRQHTSRIADADMPVTNVVWVGEDTTHGIFLGVVKYCSECTALRRLSSTDSCDFLPWLSLSLTY